MDYIKAIENATTLTDIAYIVDSYLAEIGQGILARGETYAETISRLGGDDVLEAAEKRWNELES